MQAFREWIPVESFYPLAVQLGKILLILVAAAIVTKVSNRFVRRLRERIVEMMKHGAEGSTVSLEQRATTISRLLRKTFATVVWAVAFVMVLKEIGFDIAPVLAGAGVIGLAVGFGAQNLVRDVISGLFILMENQIRVNDVAVLNGTGGLVEEINLRTTVLRGLDGAVHVFPNGTITTLSNMTREFSFYVFDLGVAYKEDTDQVVALLKEVGDELMQDETYGPEILQSVEIFGVDKFADSAVIIKGRIKTRPIKQWMVGRELNRRIKKKFDEAGIEIPFPHQSLYFGEASKPFSLHLDHGSREELKQAIREVLQEVRTEAPEQTISKSGNQ